MDNNLVIAYIFLATEGALRVALLLVSYVNFEIYGQVSYIFVSAVLLGTIVSFGSGQVILLKGQDEKFCLSIFIYLTAVSFVLSCSFMFISSPGNATIGFLSILYPTLSLIAAGCRLSINIFIRFQKVLLWLIFLALLNGVQYIEFFLFIIPIANLILFSLVVDRKIWNLLAVVEIFRTPLNQKYFLSSMLNNATRFLERTVIMVALPNGVGFGQFQALRDTGNLTNFLLGPLVGEKMLQKKGVFGIKKFIFLISIIGLSAQYYLILQIIPTEFILLLAVLASSLVDTGRVLTNSLAEIKGLFSLTWLCKLGGSLTLLAIWFLNIDGLLSIFLFLGSVSLAHLSVLWFALVRGYEYPKA